MKEIIVFGATGSVGKNAIDALLKLNKQYHIRCVSIGDIIEDNIETLSKLDTDIILYKNTLKEEDLNILKNKFSNRQFLDFDNNYDKILKKYHGRYFFNALSSIYGIMPLYKSILYKYKKVFLANKESLVMAGDIIISLSKKNKTQIIPIDSEHYALRYLLKHHKDNIKKYLITASGGALRDYDINKINNVLLEDVLKHPTWKMGKEITINSATMANKVFEVVEAHHLFNIEYENIQVLINEQSLVHAGVILKDNRIILNISKNNMYEPIYLALVEECHTSFEEPEIDLTTLTFKQIDTIRYPIFKLGLKVIKKGGLYNTLFVIANQALVKQFIDGKINYQDIYLKLEEIIKDGKNILRGYNYSIEDIIKLSNIIYKKIIG